MTLRYHAPAIARVGVSLETTANQSQLNAVPLPLANNVNPLKPLPLVRPAEHLLCPYCGRLHAIETQDVCHLIRLAATGEAALDRILTRP